MCYEDMLLLVKLGVWEWGVGKRELKIETEFADFKKRLYKR